MVSCGAEVSDHFDAWMALGAAVIAAVIALAGVGLASLLENRREAARRHHEKETRFHDERLAAYIEFIGMTDSLLAHATVWMKTLDLSSFLDYAVRAQVLGPYNKSYARVSMLAKAPLTKELWHVHSYVKQLVTHEPLSLLAPSFAEQIVADAISARIAFETAAKEELGIT